MLSLENTIGEKQNYITNLEKQLKTTSNDVVKIKNLMESETNRLHQLEIKLLNSTEEKISNIKSDYEDKILRNLDKKLYFLASSLYRKSSLLSLSQHSS